MRICFWLRQRLECRFDLLLFIFFQDPAGIFELVELVGNGTYGQVYKVSSLSLNMAYVWFRFMNAE